MTAGWLAPHDLDLLQRSRFAIERELGRGGTAFVYLAHDRILDRRIALKVLDPRIATSAGADRFEREVKDTARLVHPNIVPLFDSGSIGELRFYVMPFVEGETLRQLIEREGPLPPDRVIAIMRDVAEALAYAHGQGIVHRDIKPENVFAYQNRALVADFGIAKGLDRSPGPDLTEAGLIVGTAHYLSPEQAAGDAVDGRADLYSLGCMTFELVTGTPPFDAPNVLALMSKHLLEVPPTLESRGIAAPRELGQLIDRLLAKDPARRPESAVQLLDELKLIGTRAAEPAPAPPSRAVAVLPLQSLSADPDNEYFSEGLTEDLTTALHQMLGLDVVPRSAVSGFRNRNVDPRQAARMLGVAHVVEGTVRRAGDRLRVTAQLVSADGVVRWADRFDGTIDDLFGLQDAITSGVVAAIRPVSTVLKPTRAPRDPQVHDLIIRSRALWRRSVPGGPGAKERLALAENLAAKALALAPEDPEAIEIFGNCIGVAAIRGFIPFREGIKQSIDLMHRALALDPNLSHALVSLGVQALYFDDDFELAADLFARAATQADNDPEVLRFNGIVLKILGRYDEAVAAHRRAADLDPNAAVMFNGLGDVLIAAGRHDHAIDALRIAIRLDPKYDAALERLELACFRSGRMDEAFDARHARLSFRGALDRAAALAGGTASRGYSIARREDLERELAAMLDRAGTIDPFANLGSSRTLADDLVIVLAELGRWTEAMDWIERGYHQRPGRLRRTLTDFPFDRRGLAIDPRYARLLRTASLEDLLN